MKGRQLNHISVTQSNMGGVLALCHELGTGQSDNDIDRETPNQAVRSSGFYDLLTKDPLPGNIVRGTIHSIPVLLLCDSRYLLVELEHIQHIGFSRTHTSQSSPVLPPQLRIAKVQASTALSSDKLPTLL